MLAGVSLARALARAVVRDFLRKNLGSFFHPSTSRSLLGNGHRRHGQKQRKASAWALQAGSSEGLACIQNGARHLQIGPCYLKPRIFPGSQQQLRCCRQIVGLKKGTGLTSKTLTLTNFRPAWRDFT